jgi:hypothetical protein
MTPRLLGIGIISLAGTLAGPELLACGDKYFIAARGVGYQQAYKAKVPGSIVIFAPAQPGVSVALRSAPIQAALRSAGHRLVVAGDAAELERLLRAGGIDIVVTDLGRAPAIAQQQAPGRTRATVLPVMAVGKNPELTACRVSFTCELKSADKPERFVLTINAVMSERAKALKSARGN